MLEPSQPFDEKGDAIDDCDMKFVGSFSGVVPGGAGGAMVPPDFGGAMVPPDFGRSVNPISTREGRLCPNISTGTPGFSGHPTAL